MTFNVQKYLIAKRSGLAKLSIKTPQGYMLVAQWIDQVAAQYRIQIPYLLAVLQAEQGLLTNPLAPQAELTLVNLPDQPNPAWKPGTPDTFPKPVVGPGEFVVRNGGPKHTPDGNWYVKGIGNYPLAFALGAGAPDPGVFPPWDVRKYLGLANQIAHAAKLLRSYLDHYASIITTEGRQSPNLLVRLYSGETVRPADATTWAILQYTPDLGGLVERPKIVAQVLAEAQKWGAA